MHLHAVANEVGIWHLVSFECTNRSLTTDRRLWICWGGTADADLSVHLVPAASTTVIVDRRRVRNMAITAFETTGSGELNVYPQVDVLIEKP